jgi:hypothetical protein
MKEKLKIIPVDLLKPYLSKVNKGLSSAFDKLKDAEISTKNFSFYTSVSSVFSSKIEGEEIDLDSYIKHKKFGIEFLPDYTKKIDDLYNAYTFAKSNTLNKKNIEKAHKLLGKHIVAKHQQGKIRIHNMYVATPDGKIEYVAATMQRFLGEDVVYISADQIDKAFDFFKNDPDATKDTIKKYFREGNVIDYYGNVYGIEKEYRLSKVAKVSAFMYGQDNINIVYADAITIT